MEAWKIMNVNEAREVGMTTMAAGGRIHIGMIREEGTGTWGSGVWDIHRTVDHEGGCGGGSGLQ